MLLERSAALRDHREHHILYIPRQFRPAFSYPLQLAVNANTRNAVKVSLPDTTKVVLPFHFLGMTRDGRHRPRVFQGFAEVLHRIAAECLEQVFPGSDSGFLEDRSEPAVLVAVAGTVAPSIRVPR